MRPVRAGRLRGQIRNVRRSFDVSDFGEVTVIDFDLFVDDDLPMVPVRMSGIDFMNEPHEGSIVDVRDPDPTVRPIVAYRLDFPPNYEHDVVCYYPGRDDLPPARQRLNGLLMVFGPILFAVLLLSLALAFRR